MESSKSTAFSLVRVGYEVLPYFTNDQDSYLTYTILEDYIAVVEPNADMQFTVINSNNESGLSWRYSICDEDNICTLGEFSSDHPSFTTTFSIDCTPYSEYTISATEMSETGSSIGSFEGKAICLYVRREISSLTSGDLEVTMDAMYTIWNTSEIDGQLMYGENFHSSKYLASAHDFNAAQQDADHIHEGLGFLPQHIKLTNMFELSMQAINPMVSLPYWDFTIDVAANRSIFESIMFTSETFGSISRPVSHFWGQTYDQSLYDSKILDGRWKGIKADLNTYEGLGNGFGYMRGPWNMNPNPHVSRFSAYTPSLPSCSDYYGGLGMPDMIEFLQSAPYGPHSSTHGVIGSVYGCDKMDTLREQGIIKDEDSQLSICKKWGFYLKEFYRANYLTPRTDCSATGNLTESEIDCGFICNDEVYDEFTQEIKSTIGTTYMSSDISTEDWETFRDFICTGDGYKIFVGDHLESASPSDPSFWPIHPTQERLLHVKFIIGSFSNTWNWPTNSRESYICDKSSCYVSDIDTKGYFDSCCYGHYEYDQLLDFSTGNTSNTYGPTNHETLRDTNAGSMEYAMTYIYDNFKWDHCEDDFASTLETLYNTNRKSNNDFQVPSMSVVNYPTPSPFVSNSIPTSSSTNSPTYIFQNPPNSYQGSLDDTLSPTLTHGQETFSPTPTSYEDNQMTTFTSNLNENDQTQSNLMNDDHEKEEENNSGNQTKITHHNNMDDDDQIDEPVEDGKSRTPRPSSQITWSASGLTYTSSLTSSYSGFTSTDSPTIAPTNSAPSYSSSSKLKTLSPTLHFTRNPTLSFDRSRAPTPTSYLLSHNGKIDATDKV